MIAGTLLFVAAPAAADEGQWLPEQLPELDAKQLSGRGLELEPKELFDDAGGLLRAAVSLSGCSAAFVSPGGLIATNHHCAYRAIQAQSTPEKDLLKQGFLAKKLGDELEGKGYTVQIVERISDVTTEVLGRAQNAGDDRARWEAIERAQKELTLACEKPDPSLRCDVVPFFLGSQFRLFQKRELRDVRLVYAPPAAIGEYGGEIDNWRWPRHTGDFALLRAYAAPDGKAAEHAPKNVPYKPKFWLKTGHQGVRPGEFVAVLGYPGTTQRYLLAPALEQHVQRTLPALIALYGEWLNAIQRVASQSAANELKLAAQKKSVANRLKNVEGTLAGLTATKLLERRQRQDQRLQELSKAADRQGHAEALRALSELAKRRAEHADRDLLLDQIGSGPPLLALAVELVRRAREREKPDLEREPAYMERNAVPLWKQLERRQRDFVPEVEAALIASLATRADALAEPERIAAFGKWASGATDPAKLALALLPRVRSSRLNDPAYARQLFDQGTTRELEHSPDPLLALAAALAPELEALDARRKAERGLESRWGAKYFELLALDKKGPVYPDANGTLRFSYARVMGYEPEDGLLARPQTTLSGALAKYTGTPPFDLPKSVRERAPGARASYWADPHLDDLPLCFLSNADTTGGNSGSAVVNGRGEWVGLNFDRVWENVAGDFGYSGERSRNIAVDVRYLLWMLDRVDNASALLKELGVAEYRAAATERARAHVARRPKNGATPAASETRRSSCKCELPGAGDRSLAGWLGGVALSAAAGFRRAAHSRKSRRGL